MTTLREPVLAKLARARAALEELRGEPGAAAIEWQKGYLKGLEEVLDLDGLSLRRHPRRPTAIPTGITRLLRETGAPGARGEGTIMDLSLGGCSLATAMELSTDERIELSFRLPWRNLVVTLQGPVRRATRVGEVLRAGVEFEEVAKDIAEALGAFLASPLPAEGG